MAKSNIDVLELFLEHDVTPGSSLTSKKTRKISTREKLPFLNMCAVFLKGLF